MYIITATSRSLLEQSLTIHSNAICILFRFTEMKDSCNILFSSVNFQLSHTQRLPFTALLLNQLPSNQQVSLQSSIYYERTSVTFYQLVVSLLLASFPEIPSQSFSFYNRPIALVISSRNILCPST